MARTTTRTVDFRSLVTRGKSAVTIVRLMMVLNDLSLANLALADWKEPQPRAREPRQGSARRYFMKLEISHFYEGLKIIEAIRCDPALVSLVSRCDSRTRKLFENLSEFLPKGSKRKELEKLVGQVRHNLGFHYQESGNLIQRALADRASRPEARTSSITRGRTMHLWHFRVADDIVESVVVRQIWGISRKADLRVEADRVAERVQQIVLWFGDFSAEIIWKYFDE